MKFIVGQQIRYRDGTDGKIIAASNNQLVSEYFGMCGLKFIIHDQDGRLGQTCISSMDIVVLPIQITKAMKVYQNRRSPADFEIKPYYEEVDDRLWALIKETHVTVQL